MWYINIIIWLNDDYIERKKVLECFVKRVWSIDINIKEKKNMY
jgi:hypothetical protein